jgi:hypothetical protein
MNGTFISEVEMAEPQEYSRTSFEAKERNSMPPSKPTEGLNRIPLAPAQIRSREQAYRTGARRNFTPKTVTHGSKKENSNFHITSGAQSSERRSF